MANKYSDLRSLFADIAETIREKNVTTDLITADDFPTEIEKIVTTFDYNNVNVTEIPDYTLYGCEGVQNVECYSATSIGTSAFENCRNLKTVTIGDMVEVIGENAFKGCPNAKIYCLFASKPEGWHENWNPDNCEVVWVGEPTETFDISDTEDDNVTARFYEIEDDVLFIVGGHGRARTYNSLYEVPYAGLIESITKAAILNGVIYLGNYMLYLAFNVRSAYISNTVEYIGFNSFGQCVELESIVIPSGVKQIDSYSFYMCNSISSVTIPDTVAEISAEAFLDCKNLNYINIPNKLIVIGDRAFVGTAYYNDQTNWENGALYIGNHLIEVKTYGSFFEAKPNTCTIASCAFTSSYNKMLEEVVLPEGVLVVGRHAFAYSGTLKRVSLPDSLANIGIRAFYGCSGLTSITIPLGVTTIEEEAFDRCYFKSIEVDKNNQVYDSRDNCNAIIETQTNTLIKGSDSTIIPESVTNIGVLALSYCNFTSITISNSVIVIDKMAFDSCQYLKSINYTGTVEQWNAITFGEDWDSSTPNYTIHCTDGDIAKDGTITYK